MHISYINNDRILYYGANKININDNQILEYTAYYYRNTNDNINIQSEETQFVGKVVCHRSYYEDGITGIYIDPLFVYSKTKNNWLKIINYTVPTSKYFYYPHLLMLPDKYYNFYPLYFLHKCISTDLCRFNNITDTFDLYLEEEL